MTSFARRVLRTHDLASATAFYEAVLGAWPAGTGLEPLPAAALARGARPHWLAQLAVADPEAIASALVAEGGLRLSEAASRIVLRDPCGALIALVAPSATAAASDAVVWAHLSTPDVERSRRVYREHLGGAPGEPGSRTSIAAITSPERVHPAWTFFFAVPDLDVARAKVRALGGLALDPIVTPDGARVAPCDDPQGAAFGLFEQDTDPS